MRIISLNTWGGRALHPLMHFLKREAATTGIFCLQEMHDTTREYREQRHPDEYVRWDQLEMTRRVLPGHDGYFARWADNPHRMSVALFIRHDIMVDDYGMRVIHWPQDIHEEGSAVISPRKLQFATVRTRDNSALTVVNYHAMWRDTSKRDTPERIGEMKTLAAHVRRMKGPLVLAGDLNLDPDTTAVAALISGARLHSFIHATRTAGTRTPLFRHFNAAGASAFADYMFASRPLAASCEFRVLPDLASDHAALSLEFPG